MAKPFFLFLCVIINRISLLYRQSWWNIYEIQLRTLLPLTSGNCPMRSDVINKRWTYMQRVWWCWSGFIQNRGWQQKCNFHINRCPLLSLPLPRSALWVLRSQTRSQPSEFRSLSYKWSREAEKGHALSTHCELISLSTLLWLLRHDTRSILVVGFSVLQTWTRK